MRQQRRSVLGDLIGGALAGAAATWLMDLTTTGLADQQPKSVAAREKAAQPNGRSSTANLVARVDTALDLGLTDADQARAAMIAHYGLGMIPGAGYAVLSRRLPFLRGGQGLAYGLALWAANDEFLNSRLGLSGPFAAYPVESHWRGIVGHAVLGLASDSGITLLRR